MIITIIVKTFYLSNRKFCRNQRKEREKRRSNINGVSDRDRISMTQGHAPTTVRVPCVEDSITDVLLLTLKHIVRRDSSIYPSSLN